MPFAGWRSLLDVMVEQAFDERGHNRITRMPKEGAGTRSAVRVVAQAIALMEAHPALRGELAMYESRLAIPAWGWPPNRCSLTPTSDDFVLLTPVVEYDRTVTFQHMVTRLRGASTLWLPVLCVGLVIPGVFADPAEHQGW